MRMKRKNNVVILLTIVLVMMVITSVNGGSSMMQHPHKDRHFISLGYKFTPPGSTIHVSTTSGTINLQPSMNDESSSSSSDDEDRHRKSPKEKDATSYEQDFGDIPKTVTTTTCNETGYAGTNGTHALITIDFYYGIESLSTIRTDELHSFVFPEVDRVIADALLPLVVPPPCADVGRLDPFHWNHRQRRLDRVGIAPYPDEAVLTDVLCPFNLTETSHACIVIGAAFTSIINDNSSSMMDESKRFLVAIEQMMEEGALDDVYPEKVVRIVFIQFDLVKNVAQLPEPPPQRTVDVTPTEKEEDGDDRVKWYWWLLLAIVIAILLLILYLYYRRRSEYRKFDDEGNSDIEPTLDVDEEAAETSNPFLL